MARTIPFPFASHWDESKLPAHVNEAIPYFIQEYESNLASEDVCTDEDNVFYEGMSLAYANVLCHLLQVPVEVWDTYRKSPKTLFSIDPKGKTY